jgi:hypothetical protein
MASNEKAGTPPDEVEVFADDSRAVIDPFRGKREAPAKTTPSTPLTSWP